MWPVFMKVSWEKIQNTKNEDTSTATQEPQTQKLLPTFPEHSSYASPFCIVKKKPHPSQPNKLQLRMCIDYRKVNQSLIMAHNISNSKVVATFPLPKIQELLRQANTL